MTRRMLTGALVRSVVLGGLLALPALEALANTFVVYGASGRVGGVIVSEALERGHEVIGVSRNPASLEVNHRNFSAVAGDATSLESMLGIIHGVDAVVIAVSGIGPGNKPEEAVTSRTAETYLQAAAQLGEEAPKVVQVSGGTTLRLNGVWGLDDPELEEGTRRHGQYFGHWRAIEAYRASSGIEWAVMTPPPSAMLPGDRTGVYRLGEEDVLFNAEGDSTITVADFAVAVIDEAESPQSLRKRVAVGPPY